MTPKEIAAKLFTDMHDSPKQCALIAINREIENHEETMKLAEEEKLHPHAIGLLAGLIKTGYDLKTEIEML